MSIVPVLTFKAGQCELDTSSKPYKVKCSPTPGYVYLYQDDSELIHFCWRPRNKPVSDPDNLDLIMFPGDCRFLPNEYKQGSPNSTKTDGRIFVLKFSSSSQRHLFWLQSKTQHIRGDASWFSPRDLKIGDIVDRMLQGEVDIDVNGELAAARSGRRDDDDETMEDVEGHGDPNDPHSGGTGGAGPGATGGDVREEGENAREGGADGARAIAENSLDREAHDAVRNFLATIGNDRGRYGESFPSLNDLLTPSDTVAMADTANETQLDRLLDQLPSVTILLGRYPPGTFGGPSIPHSELKYSERSEPDAETMERVRASMTVVQKRAVVSRVLRSPQFAQSLTSLTVALREGGLPTVASSLGVKVENGGYLHHKGVPVGGGEAVEKFIDGVRTTMKEKREQQGEEEQGSSNTGEH